LNGKQAGKGKLFWENGESMTGEEWKEFKCTGNSLIEYSNGSTLFAEFSNGVAVGAGTYADSEGTSYRIDWVSDKGLGKVQDAYLFYTDGHGTDQRSAITFDGHSLSF
jgi:hypothetical protein